MKKNILRGVAAVLAIAIVVGVVIIAKPKRKIKQFPITSYELLANEGFKPVLENDKYSISFDEFKGTATVLDKATGYKWYTNPQGIGQDASDENLSHLNSQIIVEYYDGMVIKPMDSFASCVALNNDISSNRLTWRHEDNAVSVNYSMGESQVTIDMFPRIISKERMEEKILSKLTEEEKDDLLYAYELYDKADYEGEDRNTIIAEFPILDKHPVYVRTRIPAYRMNEYYAYFQKADYTFDDLQFDCDDNDVENTYVPSPHFEIELRYILTDDGFKAFIDPQKIEYNEDFKPARIRVLPFFGAAGENEDGYILVPDGSGSVIEFNNGKTTEDNYWKDFFGTDYAFDPKGVTYPDEASVMPVFALSNKKAGFLATVDSGYEVGGVSADISGRLNDYNYVFPYFNLFSFSKVSLGAQGSFMMSTKGITSLPIEVSYHLTQTPKSYAEFAGMYRELLEKNEMLPKNNKVDLTVLDVNFIGTAGVTNRFMGVPYDTTAALTDYEAAAKIIGKLGKIKSDVNYINALEGGNTQKSADRIKVSGKLGSKKELQALMDKSNSVYFSLYSQLAASVGKTDRVLTHSNTSAVRPEYDKVTEMISPSKYYVVAPHSLVNFTEKLNKDLSKLKGANINIYDVGYNLTSNFDKECDTDRTESRRYIEIYLKDLSKNVKISADKGSIYSLKFLSKIRSIPTTDSGYGISDYSVPFYQIAISGSVDYSVAPINDCISARKQFLKAVETGARLQYTWYDNRPDNITKAEENYYTFNYVDTIEQAKDYMAEYKPLAEKISGKKIVNHKNLGDGLFEIEWDNGIKVYVNYSDADKTVNGKTVKALGFIY